MDFVKPLSPLNTYEPSQDDSFKLFPLLEEADEPSTWFSDYVPDLPTELPPPFPICTICCRPLCNAVLPLRVKRRKLEGMVSEMTEMICEDCMNATSSTHRQRSPKSKRLVKRRRTRRRGSEALSSGESLQLARLKQQQNALLENAKDLPDLELRRLKQVVRNRISAQQSRDKKKYYVQQIESDIARLETENDELKAKMDIFENENSMLKDAIAKMRNHKTPYISKKARRTTIALASILTVMMAVGTCSQDSTSTEEDSVGSTPSRELLDLREFKDLDGVTIEEKVNEVMTDLGLDIESYLPVEKEKQYNDLSIAQDYATSVNYDLENSYSAVQDRLMKMDSIENDSCYNQSSEIESYRSSGILSTAHCPSVQISWKEAGPSSILQLIMPLTADSPFKVTRQSDSDYLDVVCKVLDVSVLPKTVIPVLS